MCLGDLVVVSPGVARCRGDAVDRSGGMRGRCHLVSGLGFSLLGFRPLVVFLVCPLIWWAL